MAMVHARAFENVYELEGVDAVLDAEVGMQGRTEATARLADLARLVRGEHASGMDWACWTRAGLANASLSRARSVHRDDQQGLEILQDKVRERGEAQRD
jgi:hypothetical protein